MSQYLPAGRRIAGVVNVLVWFCRIETGERIKDLLLNGWNTQEARRRLTGVRPLVTGAWQIKFVNGLDKLEGALQPIGKGAQSPRQRAAVSVGWLV